MSGRMKGSLLGSLAGVLIVGMVVNLAMINRNMRINETIIETQETVMASVIRMAADLHSLRLMVTNSLGHGDRP